MMFHDAAGGNASDGDRSAGGDASGHDP